jgi:low affinity Fe/Cu permease
MTLLIQRTEHRDTQALQAKLDELLHANRQANNALTKIDDQEPEDIVRHRTEARAAD